MSRSSLAIMRREPNREHTSAANLQQKEPSIAIAKVGSDFMLSVNCLTVIIMESLRLSLRDVVMALFLLTKRLVFQAKPSSTV